MITDATGLDPLRDRLIGFIRQIGIAVRDAALDEACVVPGLDIRGGAIIVDQRTLQLLRSGAQVVDQYGASVKA